MPRTKLRRTVDGIDDPAVTGRTGVGPVLFSQEGIVGESLEQKLSQEGFGLAIGHGDRTPIGFPLDQGAAVGMIDVGKIT